MGKWREVYSWYVRFGLLHHCFLLHHSFSPYSFTANPAALAHHRSTRMRTRYQAQSCTLLFVSALPIPIRSRAAVLLLVGNIQTV
jgi:hypothetical protein